MELKSYYRNYSKGIALTIGFLLGIEHELLIRHLEDTDEYNSIKEKLEKDADCVAIRHLNNIRSNLMLRFTNVAKDLKNISADYKPIDKMELFEEDFKCLYKLEIFIISGNRAGVYVR